MTFYRLIGYIRNTKTKQVESYKLTTVTKEGLQEKVMTLKEACKQVQNKEAYIKGYQLDRAGRLHQQKMLYIEINNTEADKILADVTDNCLLKTLSKAVDKYGFNIVLPKLKEVRCTYYEARHREKSAFPELPMFRHEEATPEINSEDLLEYVYIQKYFKTLIIEQNKTISEKLKQLKQRDITAIVSNWEEHLYKYGDYHLCTAVGLKFTIFNKPDTGSKVVYTFDIALIPHKKLSVQKWMFTQSYYDRLKELEKQIDAFLKPKTTIKEKVEYIKFICEFVGKNMFNGCKKLTNLYISDLLEYIRTYDGLTDTEEKEMKDYIVKEMDLKKRNKLRLELKMTHTNDEAIIDDLSNKLGSVNTAVFAGIMEYQRWESSDGLTSEDNNLGVMKL